jgi:hypothetical protein
MRAALWLAAVALPLAAQPKLLVNAQVDTRSAAAGLAGQFHALTSAQPQPAWIGYAVPVIAGRSLDCQVVSPNGSWAPGVVHLEAPDHLVVLIRVEAGAVERVRAISPDCEIDAGGAPVHWLTDVRPAESVALLGGMAAGTGRVADGALAALALHADPAATDWLISMAREGRDARTRGQAVSALSRRSGAKVVEAIVAAVQGDADVQVRRRAMTALGALPDGAGVPWLIQTAKTSQDSEVRKQAMSCLSATRDPRVASFFEDLLKK